MSDSGNLIWVPGQSQHRAFRTPVSQLILQARVASTYIDSTVLRATHWNWMQHGQCMFRD